MAEHPNAPNEQHADGRTDGEYGTIMLHLGRAPQFGPLLLVTHKWGFNVIHGVSGVKMTAAPTAAGEAGFDAGITHPAGTAGNETTPPASALDTLRPGNEAGETGGVEIKRGSHRSGAG